MEEETAVLCGANSYNKKYYFNEKFAGLPEAVKKQLQVLCVWFTEECGGILTLEFMRDGSLSFHFRLSEYDGWSDQIGADLKIRQLKEEERDFIFSLETWYRLLFMELPEED